MIYTPTSTVTRSNEEAMQSSTVLLDEGQAMVSVMVGGVAYAQPSTGAAGEKFLGFSWLTTSAAPYLPTTFIKVEVLTVPVSGVVSVAKTPLAASVAAYNNTTGASVAVVSTVGQNVDLGVASAGLSVRVQYRYTLTAAQAQSLAGSQQPGGYSGALLNRVAVANQGIIYTNHFDSSVDFAAATAVKLSANGVVTDQSGAGATIDAIVKKLPTADVPFLGLQFSSAA